jgi:NADH:ubiquinone oxidoreductase subunit K
MTPEGAFILSLLLLMTGLLMVVIKKNVLVVLIGIELIFNAANVNFVVFNQYWLARGIDGQMMTLFVLAIVAAEMALALAIVLKCIKEFNTSNIDEMNSLKD